MRHLLLATALIVAAPATAQTALEQLQDMVTTDTTAAGFPESVAATIATCFTSRMTEAEAESVLANLELEEQQQALAEIAEYDQALLCAAGAMQ